MPHNAVDVETKMGSPEQLNLTAIPSESSESEAFVSKIILIRVHLAQDHQILCLWLEKTESPKMRRTARS